MCQGRSDTVANANVNSGSPRKFASEFRPPNLKQKAANRALRINEFRPPNLKQKAANRALRINLLAIANGLANEMAKNSLAAEIRNKIC